MPAVPPVFLARQIAVEAARTPHPGCGPSRTPPARRLVREIEAAVDDRRAHGSDRRSASVAVSMSVVNGTGVPYHSHVLGLISAKPSPDTSRLSPRHAQPSAAIVVDSRRRASALAVSLGWPSLCCAAPGRGRRTGSEAAGRGPGRHAHRRRDGRRSDRSSAFVQREPNEGAAPSQRTEFRVTYDATTLYVRVRAFDAEPDKIVTYLTRRDDNSPCDWLRVFIDSYHDRRTAYEFAVNPSGVKQDRYWFNDSERDDSWDAVWDVSVIARRRRLAGRVSHSVFAAAVHAGADRDVRLRRRPRDRPAEGNLDVAAAAARGDRVRVVVRRSGRAVDAGGAQAARSCCPTWCRSSRGSRLTAIRCCSARRPEAALGLDLKYGLTPGLTLTGTVNPDFGQVEADPAVVNLSAFETFFNERRPFFIEGSGNFNFHFDNGQLFYTRRIGRSPQGTGDLPSGDGDLHDAPAQTAILGAGKVTGRIGKFSIGALNAVTRQERAAVVDGTARATTAPVEPLTNYFGRPRAARVRESVVGRLHADFDASSADRRPAVPADKRRHRRRRFRLAVQVAVQPRRLLGRQRRPRRRRRRSIRIAGEQPPLLSAARRHGVRARSRRHVARRDRRARSRSGKSAASGSGSSRAPASSRRASTSATSGSSAAPTKRP